MASGSEGAGLTAAFPRRLFVQGAENLDWVSSGLWMNAYGLASAGRVG